MHWKKLAIVLFLSSVASARQHGIELTLESAVEIGMSRSYRIKGLELEIEKNVAWLESQRAGLKSKVFMNMQSPNLNRLSDYKWNSTLKRDEIIRQDTELWQADLSVRQPVVLFGYPTNGYISLNYKVYQYNQRENDLRSTNYYNRLYMRFEQPFFMTNTLKNSLERAELNLEERQLRYVHDRVNIMEGLSSDYYSIFRLAYLNQVYNRQLAHLQRAAESAAGHVQRDSTRRIEQINAELELANVRENAMENYSNLRRELANFTLRLRLNPEDSLFINPVVLIHPVSVDMNQALEYGYRLGPDIRIQEIYRRMSELDVQDQKGFNSFYVRLEMTYGLEQQDEMFRGMWDQYDNSNSVAVNAYIPIWDWNQRKLRIQAEMTDVRQREMNIEERKENIRKNVVNSVTNLNEYQSRALSMQQSVIMAEQLTAMSFVTYDRGESTMQDLLQVVERQKDTEIRFLDSYLGYRRSLLNLMAQTFYDYENKLSLVEEFKLKKLD